MKTKHYNRYLKIKLINTQMSLFMNLKYINKFFRQTKKSIVANLID